MYYIMQYIYVCVCYGWNYQNCALINKKVTIYMYMYIYVSMHVHVRVLLVCTCTCIYLYITKITCIHVYSIIVYIRTYMYNIHDDYFASENKNGVRLAVNRNNFLLRGCVLRNTTRVAGLVVYAGSQDINVTHRHCMYNVCFYMYIYMCVHVYMSCMYI